ncbi:SRPBCC family protein [Amycolatopsis sp. lyj-346]|uniref:SRPBCC family protein n=1 Tax=Amycolatopsis sp. lyj-346 TaxID=2789289 RepID=UPI003978F520
MTRTFTVAAAPPEVLDYLKDLGHAPDWHPGTLSCDRLGTEPVDVGARWHAVVKIAGVELELTRELTRLEPGRVAFTGTHDVAATLDEITITPTGAGGSTLSYHATIEFRGTAELGTPIAEVVFEKAGADAEAALTRILGTAAWVSDGRL